MNSSNLDLQLLRSARYQSIVHCSFGLSTFSWYLLFVFYRRMNTLFNLHKNVIGIGIGTEIIKLFRSDSFFFGIKAQINIIKCLLLQIQADDFIEQCNTGKQLHSNHPLRHSEFAVVFFTFFLTLRITDAELCIHFVCVPFLLLLYRIKWADAAAAAVATAASFVFVYTLLVALQAIPNGELMSRRCLLYAMLRMDWCVCA